MDVRLVLFGALAILFIPNYAEQCQCTPSGFTPSHCPQLSTITGYSEICYGSLEGNRVCVYLTCLNRVTFSATCKDNSGHGTWNPTPISCTEATIGSEVTTSSMSTMSSTLIAGSSTVTTLSTTSANTHNTTHSDDTTTDASSNTESPSSKKQKENDGDIAVIVSVPVCIVVVVIIIVIIVVILWRRKTRWKGTSERSHGAMNNNSYQDSTSNGNIIPMNRLASTTIDNGYVDIFDDKPTPEDTFDSNYNTINPHDETTNTYGSLKPGTEPFMDNTYSHMNNACVDMGAMYSHIGKSAAPQQTKRPEPISDNTYSHIGTKGTTAKTKPKAVDSGDTYSHIGKQTGVPNIKPKSVESDIMYSHIGKVVKPHHKSTDADCDATYNSLGVRPKVCLQNKQMMQYAETEDDPEYNHLTSSLQSSSTNKTSTCPSYRQYNAPTGSNTASGSPMSNQYDKVVEADTDKPRIGNYETVDDDNKTSKHSFFVLDENDDNTAHSNTDGDQTNHQYFILEKHEKQG